MKTIIVGVAHLRGCDSVRIEVGDKFVINDKGEGIHYVVKNVEYLLPPEPEKDLDIIQYVWLEPQRKEMP